jgi:curved DNA-binding protein CbpA
VDRGTKGGQAATAAPDFYRLLQVDPDAPQELIAEAYWYLAGRLQGERQGSSGVRGQFAVLNEAYATLTSPPRRMAYDATLPRVDSLRRERAHAIESARPSWFPLPGHGRAGHGLRRDLDCYALLGVDPSAETAMIDRAYSLLRLLGSDGPGSKVWELTEAHAVLADPARRAAYDALISMPGEAAEPPPAPEALPPMATEVTGPVAGQPESAAVAASRYSPWRGVAAVARLSRRFVRWAWPVVRESSRRFAAWAWPIVRRWSWRLALWAWRGTRALGRLVWGAIKGAIAEYQQRQVLTQAIDDETVRSRLSRGATPVHGTALRGGSQSPEVTSQPAARLIFEEGPQAGTIFELRDEPIMLGADEACSLRLADDDGRVSAGHALIWRRQGKFMICQASAEQPCILIGGRAVPWAVLEDGDRIEIGEHVIRFQLAAGRRRVNSGRARPRQTQTGS